MIQQTCDFELSLLRHQYAELEKELNLLKNKVNKFIRSNCAHKMKNWETKDGKTYCSVCGMIIQIVEELNK